MHALIARKSSCTVRKDRPVKSPESRLEQNDRPVRSPESRLGRTDRPVKSPESCLGRKDRPARSPGGLPRPESRPGRQFCGAGQEGREVPRSSEGPRPPTEIILYIYIYNM